MSKSPIRTTWKRVVLIFLLTVIVCVVGFFATTDYILSNAVPRAAILGFSPSNSPNKATIDKQTEPHTCGLHSLRSIYRAYGLDPDQHKLRMRLGVDIRANPVDDTSTGTLQADLTRVLAQDGFSIKALDLQDAYCVPMLVQFLETSHKAIALIKRPENGNLHYIVLQEGRGHFIELVDPLSKDPQLENTHEFISKQAVTVLMLGVEKNITPSSIKEAHRLGVEEMKNTPERIKQLK